MRNSVCNSPMSSPAHGSPWWSAEKEFALLVLLTDGNRKAAQRLWLRKVRIHREAPPDAGASAPKAATAKPQPAPARARAVPKLETAAQLARRERSQIRLRQKHLATSRARSGRACGSQAGCWRGGAERALADAGQSCRGRAKASSWRGAPVSDRERPSRRPLTLSIACLSWWAG